jgi:cyclopropane fatty-acyl-phospholipid synthase-like methyltransferase
LHQYDNHFYRFLGSFAVRSAQQIVPLLSAVLPIESVADFGCGQGAWLSVWKSAGASVMGIDGPYIGMQHLMIDADEFRAADLGQPIDLGRRFDLVQSLEVAEHLSARRATGFIEMLTAHGRLVLFSAAVPGQGGEHHINEQPLEYWRREFRQQGYLAIDYIRPLVASNPRIQHWYRYNIVLYAEETYARDLPERVRECRVAEDQKLRHYWPFYHRMCQAAVRQLPRRAVDSLSRFRVRRQVRKIFVSGASY